MHKNPPLQLLPPFHFQFLLSTPFQSCNNILETKCTDELGFEPIHSLQLNCYCPNLLHLKQNSPKFSVLIFNSSVLPICMLIFYPILVKDFSLSQKSYFPGINIMYLIGKISDTASARQVYFRFVQWFKNWFSIRFLQVEAIICCLIKQLLNLPQLFFCRF